MKKWLEGKRPFARTYYMCVHMQHKRLSPFVRMIDIIYTAVQVYTLMRCACHIWHLLTKATAVLCTLYKVLHHVLVRVASNQNTRMILT